MIIKYENYGIKESAAKIVCDCIMNGESEGWAGSREELEAVGEICNKFNVYYTNDWFGKWTLITPENVGLYFAKGSKIYNKYRGE